MTHTGAVIDWLLDPEHSDPSIRWQVMREVLDAPQSEWAAERYRVETEGWGARLLALEDIDGQWAGGAYFPGDFDFEGPEAQPGSGQPWTATTHSLSQLREFGLDPSSERARRAVERIGANARWEEGGQPYWEGEVEPCINGVTVANGAYFGVDVSPIVERLVGERLEDGGWNCETINGSSRSSFGTTINVLDGLLEYERATGGTPGSRAARQAAEEYLLERRLSPGGAPVSRPTSDSSTSCTQTDGTTTRSAVSTTSAPPPRSPALPPTHGSARPSTTFALGAWRTAPGHSTGAPRGGCGSTSTTARASALGG